MDDAALAAYFQVDPAILRFVPELLQDLDALGSNPEHAAAFRAFVERMEELPIGPGALAATLAGIIALRNVLEIVVAKNPVFHGISAFVHYPMAYVAPFFALTLVLALWAGVASARVARLMLMAWLLTLVPPVADLVLHRTHDGKLSHLEGVLGLGR